MNQNQDQDKKQAVQLGADQPGTVQPEAVHPDTNQSDTVQPDTVQPAATQATVVQAANTQATAVRPDTVQPNTMQQTADVQTALQPDTVQPAATQAINQNKVIDLQKQINADVKKERDKMKIAIILLVIVIILCLTGTIMFIVYNNNKSFNNEDSFQESTTTEPQVEASQQQQQPQIVNKDAKVKEALAKLNMTTDFRASLTHGTKTAQYQKYIVLHDTEGDGSAANVVSGWDGNGSGTGAHFVINKDGSIVQCVGIDEIAHHAGFGDTGHNAQFGVTEDGRDDRRGTQPIGSWASDYGMNSWSIGIEIVHVGKSGPYPEAQLQALDNLIAYIDAYYSDSSSGNGGTITDHKAWRTGNSDTSPEFATYLANYQSKRTH